VNDFPTRIPEMLESITARFRALTIDRAARVITIITLAGVAITLVSLALIFLLVGIFRITERLIEMAGGGTYSMEIAYAAVGGLFLLIGALLWAKRTRKDLEEEEDE
jgi:hypothetical protein